MSGILARAGSTIRALVRRWESIQVELHGSYSIERFTSMQKYCESTSSWRAFGILAITPLPSVICAAIIDGFPLESPNLGFKHSSVLWVRGLLVGFIQSYALSWIFCQYVAELQISRRVLVLTAATASIIIHGIASCLAVLLWYPLPFTVLWVSCPCVGTLALALKILRGNFLREHPKVLQEIRRFAVVLLTQMSTVLVYTAFNAIIPLYWQPLAALIAPIFKITQKNGLRRILHGKDDVVPEMTIFNIDISNAFFISSNMQRGASINTSILLVLIDLLQMLLSLCDLRLMLQSVEDIADKMEISTEEAVAVVALTIATKYPELRDRRMLTESLYHSKAEILFISSHRRTTNKKTTKSGQKLMNKAQIAPKPVENNVGDLLRSSTSHILPKARYVMEPGANSAVSIDRISSRERYLLLDKFLQIMFFTEFILLTEFIEVFTLVMYSFYLVILFYWPNRQFYPQFDGVDEAQFWKNICSTLVYGLLEMGSFALLVLVISRTTHKYPLQQLAYAIKSSKGKIQGKLLIWIIVLLQSTILQMGTDYTFKFAWIHRH